MTRNIVDHLGNIIGELTLPDETSEDEWTRHLSPYLIDPVNLPMYAGGLKTKTIMATGQVTTGSSTPGVVGSMSHKPEDAGFYEIQFNGTIYTGGASATGEFGIYVDDVLISGTEREISCNLQLLGGLVTVSLNTVGVGTMTGTEIYLNGNQTVTIKFKSTNGGTIGFKSRVVRMVKVR